MIIEIKCSIGVLKKKLKNLTVEQEVEEAENSRKKIGESVQ